MKCTAIHIYTSLYKKDVFPRCNYKILGQFPKSEILLQENNFSSQLSARMFVHIADKNVHFRELRKKKKKLLQMFAEATTQTGVRLTDLCPHLKRFSGWLFFKKIINNHRNIFQLTSHKVSTLRGLTKWR